MNCPTLRTIRARALAATTFAAAAIALALAAPAFADESIRVQLSNGDTVSGQVISDTGGILVLRTPYGLLSIPHGAITSRAVPREVEPPPAGSGSGSEEGPGPARPKSDALDKATLDEVQQVLSRIADAINRGDDEALAALITPPPAQPLAIDRLKAHSGLHRVELRAIHGRRAEGGARVTVNATELDDRGDAHVRGQEMSFERTGGEWRLATGDPDAVRRLERISTAERQAIEALRSIHKAELELAQAAAIDLDADGTGEFGYLQELAGRRLRGPRGTRPPPLAKPLIDAELARGLVSGQRYATVGDYCYALYLPGDQTAILEPAPLPDWLPVNIDRAELQFAAYAWPAEYGSSGQRAFVVDRGGVIYCSLSGLYSSTNAPPPGAAFPRRSPAPENLLAGAEFGLAAAPTVDGQPWFPLGEPYERPAPTGRFRMHIVQRLLSAPLLYPDGSLGKHRVAAPGAPAGDPPQDQEEKTKATQAELEELARAIVTYRARMGFYPPVGSQSLVVHLDGDKTNGGPEERFFPFPPVRVVDGRLLDSWGKAYRYNPNVGDEGVAMVWSIGPNGVDDDGKGDDVAVLVR